MTILAYLMRHGSTAISPKPEGWLAIGLDVRGKEDAEAGATFLEDFIKEGNPKPDWGVSSDLPRSEETLAIVADKISIPVFDPIPELRAYEERMETPVAYEERNFDAFKAIFLLVSQSKTLPLIVCHRSSTGFLGRQFNILLKNPDYTKDSLLLEGGILAITDCGIKPLFRGVESNWPKEQCR